MEDGPAAPGNDDELPTRTFIEASGAQFTVRTASTAGVTTLTMSPGLLAFEGWVTRPATDWRLIDLVPGMTPGSEAPEARVTATGTIESTANGPVIRIDVNPDGAMRLYPIIGNRATWVGFDSVTCRAQ